MSVLASYIKLQTKLSFTSNKISKTSKKVATGIISVIVFAIILGFAYLLFSSLTSQSTYISGSSVNILIFTIAQILLLIISINMQSKRLHSPDDLRIISTFPLSSFQKYVGEIIAIYIKLLVYSVVIFYPFILVYGFAGGLLGSAAGGSASAAFVFSSLLSALLLPMLPFAISLVFCVPIMFLRSWLQNKSVVKLILFLLVFAGLLVIYAFLLRLMSNWWIHSSQPAEIMKGIAVFLDKINQPYNFCYYTSQICLHDNLGVNLGILIGISLGFMIVGVAITKPLYDHFIRISANVESVAMYKHVKIDEGKTYKTIFVKEIKQIVRTQSYAFFYLGVAFATPILTYLITDIVKAVGQAHTGSNAFFGFGLLILCIIISLIGSYSANVISKEGKQFYISKTIPLTYRKQLLAKSSVNFFVSFIALVLCIIVFACTVTTTDGANFTLSIVDLLFIFAICTFLLLGITFNGVNINLVRPKVEIINGQPSESNIVIQLLISLGITTIITILALVGDAVTFIPTLAMHWTIVGLVVIYALINFLVFFFTADKKYANMEVK